MTFDHPYHGLRVVVTLDNDVTITGVLLWAGADGGVTIRTDDGDDLHGWPALDIQLANGWSPADVPWPEDAPDRGWPDEPPVRPTETVWLPGDGP